MLQAFFLWFYCLSITDAVLLVIVVSVGYLILRQWLGNKRFLLPVIALLFLAWLAVIAVATVACSGALGVIAAVLLAGIIRIICLCGVGGVHSAAARIGVTGLLCLGLFRLSARWLPAIILRAAIIIKTRIIIFTHEKSLLCSAARRLGAAGR